MAHGGHCVARVPVPGPEGLGDDPATRVVFVRHALPGETVVARITEGAERDRFWRADAVEVLEASPDRVGPPCPYAGPGLCGGCDFQHVALPRQRDLKADVVREQLRRVGKVDLDELGLDVTVEPVPGDEDGLRWRTRIRLALDDEGRAGMRAHRSHRIVPLDDPMDCRIAAPGARVEVTAGSTDADTVLGERPAGDRGADDGPARQTVTAGGAERRFALAADGFWQVHPGAPAVLVDAVLGMLAPRPGERALDLYAGVGLFARYLADALGPGGSVVAVEGDPVAASHAADNLAGLPVRVLAGRVDGVLEAGGDGDPGAGVDLVVLDPPREGARREVVELVAARSPRAVAYVACDPASLARDVRTFLEHGYRLTALRAFDAFPMTHHVETVALLERGG